MHHDNIFISMATIFQIISLEGWTYNMQIVQEAQSYYNFFFYIPLVFITAYLIEEFTRVIISISFMRVVNRPVVEEKEEKTIPDSVFKVIYDNSTKEFMENLQNINDVTGNKPLDNKIFEAEVKLTDNDDGSIEIKEKFKKVIKKTVVAYNIQPHKPFSNKDQSLFDFVEKNSLVYKNPKSHHRKLTIFNRFTQESIKEIKPHDNLIPSDNQNDLENTTKKQKVYEKVRRSVVIKSKTLDLIKNDASIINNLHIQISESYIQFSESFNDVLDVNLNKIPEFSTNFVYSTENPLGELWFSQIDKFKQKYFEFLSVFSLLSYLSLRSSKKAAFFQLALPVSFVIKSYSKLEFTNYSNWSGLDVNSNNEKNSKLLLQKLSNMSFTLWSKGALGSYERFKQPLKVVIKHKVFDYLMLLCVLINTGALAYDHYGISQQGADALQLINNFFTFLFAAELTLKIIGLGIKEYLRDPLNYFDSIVVSISLIEFIISSGSSAVTAFRAIRIFRIFRVLRVIRLFRYLKSLNHIVNSIAKSLPNMGYLGLLLLLFQIIFTLINMQVFGGTFNFPQGVPRANFDTFQWSFITTFQLLSTENFNDPFSSCLRSSNGPISGLLPIIWVCIGHFVLLTLVLGILLGSFEGDNEQTNDIEILKSNSKINEKLQVVENFHGSDSEASFNPESENVGTAIEGLGCNYSYFVFSRTNPIRTLCYTLCVNPLFDYFFLFIIVLSCAKLTWETYIINVPTTSIEYIISSNMDMVFTSLFTVEFLIKSVGLGFMNEKKTYLVENWNKLDFLVVIFCWLDVSVSSINFQYIKVIRLLRAFRPLKIIKHNKSMRILVAALLESIASVLNYMLFVFIVWLIFAILGVSLLAGKMYSCSNPSITTIDECLSQGYE